MVRVLGDATSRALIESLPDAVIVVNRTGTIVLVNAQTEALFGYERLEMVNHPIEMLVPEDMRAAHNMHREQYARHPGTRPMGVGLELRGRRRDGSHFPVEISLSPLVRGDEMYVTSVIRDVSERNRLRSELERQEDRQRIAMDLHDGTIQSIYAIGLGLEIALTDIVQDPVAAGRRVDGLIEQLNTVIHDIRGYIFDLRPVQFAGDLLQDLILTIEEFRASSAVNVASDLPLAIPKLHQDRAIAMLHIAREALSNARKHAQASDVHVTIVAGDDSVDMAIQDDGVGFDQSVAPSQTHRGLRNMRQRTQHLGGSFDLESAPGAGTVLRVRMPAGR